MRRGKIKNRRFVLLDRKTLISNEWKALSHSEMIAYIYLKNNYNGANNGNVPLRYTELKGIMSPATLSKALKRLRSKEWIERTQHGGLYRYYCLYKLTGRYDDIR